METRLPAACEGRVLQILRRVSPDRSAAALSELFSRRALHCKAHGKRTDANPAASQSKPKLFICLPRPKPQLRQTLVLM
jgi:hypothetical protein